MKRKGLRHRICRQPAFGSFSGREPCASGVPEHGRAGERRELWAFVQPPMALICAVVPDRPRTFIRAVSVSSADFASARRFRICRGLPSERSMRETCPPPMTLRPSSDSRTPVIPAEQCPPAAADPEGPTTIAESSIGQFLAAAAQIVHRESGVTCVPSLLHACASDRFRTRG